MFKYEDLDYQSLSNSLDIENPDGPEELYALAQFCRMGKGIQASEENYRLYLQRAADAGSEQAKAELAALDAPQDAQQELSGEEKAVETMSLTELLHEVNSGNPHALLPLAKQAMTDTYKDLPKAREWLEQAAELVPQGTFSDEVALDIYLTLGRLLKKPEFDTPENREECHRYFGLAAELGSAVACDELAYQYRTGYGCEVDKEQAKLYASRGCEDNDPGAMVFYALYTVQDAGSSKIELAEKLDRIRRMTDDRRILLCTNLIAAAAGFEPLKPETAEWAWNGYEAPSKKFNPEIKVVLPAKLYMQDSGTSFDAAIAGVSEVLARAYGDSPAAAIAQGLPVDTEKAALLALWSNNPAWVEDGAKENDPLSLFVLGVLNEEGRGMPENPEKGFSLCLKAAQAGYVYAQTYTAQLYYGGHGTERNEEQFLYWTKKAAEAGIPFAMYMLGDTFCSRKSFPDALYWLEKAAAENDPNALHQLGCMYRDGIGVPKDRTKAISLFMEAAQDGHGEALDALGWAYLNGIDVPEDYDKAKSCFEEAAQKGVKHSLTGLGVLSHNGYGVPQDYEQAAKYYQMACDTDPLAMYYLGVLYRDGRGVPQDYARAFSLFSTAAEKGLPVAKKNLAGMYEAGLYVQKDMKMARKYYTEAAAAGNFDSKEWLRDNPEGAEKVKKSAANATIAVTEAERIGFLQCLSFLGCLAGALLIPTWPDSLLLAQIPLDLIFLVSVFLLIYTFFKGIFILYSDGGFSGMLKGYLKTPLIVVHLIVTPLTKLFTKEK